MTPEKRLEMRLLALGYMVDAGSIQPRGDGWECGAKTTKKIEDGKHQSNGRGLSFRIWSAAPLKDCLKRGFDLIPMVGKLFEAVVRE
jgi:hypothetical protein